MSITADIVASVPLREQLSAVQVLADLINRHPDLPAPYVVIQAPFSGFDVTVDLQVAGHEFEPWREVLGIEPESVSLHNSQTYTWVAAQVSRAGVCIRLSGYPTPLSPEQADAPRDLSEATR